MVLGGGLAATALVMLVTFSAPTAQAVTTGGHPGKDSGPRSTPSVGGPAVSGLAISVTDGRTRARPGDRLSYIIRVKDSGSEVARDLTVTLSLPAYLKVVSVRPHARAAAGRITWHASLRPGTAAAFRLSARLARTPAGLVRLAAVACAVGGGGKTKVCAAHLDVLPGASRASGASAGRSTAGSSSRTLANGGLSGFAVAGLALVAAAALAAFGAAWIRGWRPRRLNG